MRVVLVEKKKVLVVDDAKFTRVMLSRIINSTKFAEVIAEASNGQEAIKLYKIHKPDLVTMDLIMPVKGGIETTEEIMKMDKKAEIVVVTAMGQEYYLFKATEKGAKDFITKPFRKEDLIHSMETLLLK